MAYNHSTSSHPTYYQLIQATQFAVNNDNLNYKILDELSGFFVILLLKDTLGCHRF